MRHAQAPQPGADLPWQEARLFAEVYERIKREYVDEVDDRELMERPSAAWWPRSIRTPPISTARSSRRSA